MTFTGHLWNEIENIYAAILEQPFIEELTDGTLALETFKFYLQQDALYLEDFSRALALTGTKAPDSKQMLQFLEFARGAIVTERALHESYFEEYDVSMEVGRSPACFSYTNFLVLTAYHQPYEVSVAALLPCFWIYRDIGNYIYEAAKKDNPYHAWIETYSGEEFGEAVEQAIHVTEEVSRGVSEEVKECMMEHFVFSSRLEWMFWDSAYNREAWKP